MTHLSVSISNEHCFGDTTLEQPVCHAEKNCPGSSVCVGTADSVSASASALPKTRENASVFGYVPTTCRYGRRKKPTSGELHACECRLQAADLGSWSAASFGRPEDGSPRGQTRRRKSSGHWRQADSHNGESLFFRRQLRVVAFLPGLCTSQPDFCGLENPPNCLNADRINDILIDDELLEFPQRPASKRSPEKVRRTKGGLNNETSLLLGEFSGASSAVFGSESRKATGVEVFDNGSDVLWREVEASGNVGNSAALSRGQNNLRSPDSNAVAVTADDTLKLASLGWTDLTDIKAHSESPHVKSTSLSTRGTLYNTNVCIAQLFIWKKVILPCEKRH